jgi:hypothetical protein
MSTYPSESEKLKNYVSANITGLHGPVYDFKIDKLIKNKDMIEVEGTYRIQFDNDYKFTMTIDLSGNIFTYERKPKTNEFDRISIS